VCACVCVRACIEHMCVHSVQFLCLFAIIRYTSYYQISFLFFSLKVPRCLCVCVRVCVCVCVCVHAHAARVQPHTTHVHVCIHTATLVSSPPLSLPLSLPSSLPFLHRPSVRSEGASIVYRLQSLSLSLCTHIMRMHAGM
jgi:hypothetical protein